MSRDEIERLFPALLFERYEVTSPPSNRYNCVAWAVAADERKWWEPDPNGQYYWPHGVPRERTVEGYIRAFECLGFTRCEDGTVEKGYEKVAIYVHPHGQPTHVARQLPNGQWTSKLGRLEDVEHRTLEGLRGVQYGNPRVVLRRPVPH